MLRAAAHGLPVLATALLFDRVGHGQGGQEFLGVAVLRVAEHLRGSALLANHTLLQHDDPVGDRVDHRQVVVELLGLVQRLLGVGHGLDHVAAVRQAGLQVMAQQRVFKL